MFKKILYPVDLAHTDFAAQFAPDVEKAADTFGAEIEVMSAVPGFGMAIVASYFPPDAQQEAIRDMEARLQEFAASAFKRPVAVSVAQGTHWKRIIDTAEAGGADLIVMPHCDKGWPDNLLLGSCTQKVAEQAACSVLVLRPTDKATCPT
jgi:nucleotide-binding universal stress UspA family protein